MSKRFHDSGLWNEDWFIELSTEHKLFYQYKLDNYLNPGIAFLLFLALNIPFWMIVTYWQFWFCGKILRLIF